MSGANPDPNPTPRYRVDAATVDGWLGVMVVVDTQGAVDGVAGPVGLPVDVFLNPDEAAAVRAGLNAWGSLPGLAGRGSRAGFAGLWAQARRQLARRPAREVWESLPPAGVVPEGHVEERDGFAFVVARVDGRAEWLRVEGL